MSQQLAAEVFRMAGESIEVRAAPLDDVLAQASERRSRRRRRTAAALLAGALVVGAVTWAAVRDRSPADDLDAALVKRSLNPVGVAWYADGTLHLDRVTVQLPPLDALFELNGGALYADADGTIAFVAADGDRRRLGHHQPGTAVVTSAEIGWVAWLDTGDDGPELVVYDVSMGGVLATRATSPGVRLVAIDQARVYYEDGAAAYAWTPGAPTPDPLARGGLVDVESATRVYQDGRRVDMVQSLFSVHFLRPGVGGLLSPQAWHLLTRSPDGPTGAGAPFVPLLYDATSGARLPSGVDPRERVVDAAFGDDGTLTYLVDPAGPGGDDRLLALRTCEIGLGCDDVASVPAAGRPLLAH